MKCYKEKELIVFDFENGKRASYNLNTGETRGKTGRPVQSLCSALSGYDIHEILDSFTDKRYADFLRYVFDRCVPKSYVRVGYNWEYKSRISNLGTLFKYVSEHKAFEGYYIAGYGADRDIRTPITEVPKGLLKLCREYQFNLTDLLIKHYKSMPDAYTMAFAMEFAGITPAQLKEILDVLVPASTHYHSYVHRGIYSNMLVHEWNYNLRALLKYIDYLSVFEGIEPCKALVTEIGDYANMMRQISDKYEKYPRYFLSSHKIACRNYNRLKQQFDEQNFQKQRKPEYEITCGDYVFIYPKTTQEIKDEAVQQNNCVASYIQRVIEGDCHILFLRKKDAPNASLVTIEVRNGTIVQARQAYNNPITAEQQEAVNAFNKKFGKKGE
ncbi:MAG: PcfJ domain-containing protein [Bacteroidaceae bacterium]|nr:PcfJ domain-containing protein [Bacteroidaceae bacterium]